MRATRLTPDEAVKRAAERPADEVDPALVEQVEEIRARVLGQGDEALLELTNSLDCVDAPIDRVVVDPVEARNALDQLDTGLRRALELAAANIRAVAEASRQPTSTTVELPQGHEVEVERLALEAAGVYAPGGRASYPSSVLMGAIPADVAGVDRTVLVTPPGPNGRIDPVTLAAAEISGVGEIYSVGGAQAVFALAYGTASIEPVDVIVGPGNRWVQEAKRRVFGEVALDSIAGPSDLTVIFGAEADHGLVAVDLAAQAEHGIDSLVVAVALAGADLGRVMSDIEGIAAVQPTVADCELWLVEAGETAEAVRVVEAIAPEHLELIGAEAEGLVGQISNAGCVFVGRSSATAFGDYVAGSNHILPTDGSARSFGPLSVNTFQKPISRVTLTQEAADLLAEPTAVIADSEGFPVHGLSALRRKSK